MPLHNCADHDTDRREQVLPKRFGGDAELIPIHEACQMQRRQSSLAALKKKTRAVEHKRDLASSRLAGAGR